MIEVNLTQGRVAKVDDRDAALLSACKWCARRAPSGYIYAVRSLRVSGKKTTQQMHRLLLGLVAGDKREVDHINHDTLDNRRRNIRIVTHRQNSENLLHASKYGTGIYNRPRCRFRPFCAAVELKGKRYHIGCFATAKEAVAARITWLNKHTST